MSKYYQVVTDGKTFRVTARSYGGDDVFAADYNTGKARGFQSKEEAERYIHEVLSMDGWKKA